MAVTTLRAAQTSYPTTFDGGTSDQFSGNGLGIGPFMDAIERQDTKILNSMKKGKAGNQRKERTGMHGVTPRGSKVGSAVLAADTTVNLPAGHGVRFQQGHVLQVTAAASGATEIMWVNADPATGSLSVKRAQAGTTAIGFAANDTIRIIGIAMPQLSDYPLAPVSRGRMFHNFYQEFSKHLTISNQADQEPSIEFPQGGLLAKDMVKLGKELKMDLEQAFINGRRQEGTPDPSNPIPAMTGGLIQFAELSGNVFNVGGAAVLLSIDVINEALITLDESIGDNRGAKMLMSHRTKQIFNRLKYPSDYNRGTDGTNVDLRWNTVETDFGRLEFESEYGIPDGLIILFDPSEMEYAPFVGEDWHEKDVPTKGNYKWRGVSGTYTFRPGAVPGYALINNFNTTLSAYPAWGTP